MTALLRAEARKLVTTRSSLALVAVGVVYGALGVAAAAFAPEAERPMIDGDTILQIVRGVADLAAPVALLLGILATAGEYRHGTIVPTLLVTPSRGRLLTAKLGFHAALGAAIGLAGSVVALVAGAAYLQSEDAVAQAAGGDIALAVVGVTVVAAVYGALGASIGTLVRNQTGAVTAGLVWLLVVEEMVPIVLRAPSLRNWLLDGAATRVLHLSDPGPGAIPLWAAAAVLLGALVALTVPAAVRAVRGDVG